MDATDRRATESLWQLVERMSTFLFAASLAFAIPAFPMYKGQWIGLAPVVGGGILFLISRKKSVAHTLLCRVADMNRRRLTTWLWFLAIGVRGIGIICFADSPVSDHATYHESAVRMLNGHAYPPSAYYPPGMAFWLLLVYTCFGESPAAALIINAFIGGLMSWLTYITGRHIISESAARIAAFACALFPSLVIYSTTLGYDPILGCTILLAVWLIVRKPAEQHQFWYVGFIGVVLGVCSFIKPIGLLLPFVFAITYLRRRAGVVRSLRNGILMMATMLMTLAPWSIRNAVMFGKYVPVTTSGGVGLWIANHEGATGLTCPLPWFPPGTSEVERDRMLWREAWSYMLTHPIETIAMLPKKVAYLWGTSSTVMATVSADRWHPYLEAGAKAIINVAWVWVVLWFLVGAVGSRRIFIEKTYLWPAGMMLIYLFAVHQFYEAQSRYHLPFLPYLLMCAAAAFCTRHQNDIRPSKANLTDE
jgi:4-amino-4-deoxy-L-arabinose transferase-like glycosyltransferase